jgi:integrase
VGRKNLTDRTLKALKPAPAGKRVEVWDSIVPGLGVRVTDRGTKTFALVTRYPGSPINPKTGAPNPSRRALGEYGALTLEQARGKAREWLKLIGQGKDPAQEEEHQRLAEQRKRENSFAAVAEEFVAYIKRQKLRTADVMERNLRRTFVARWASRPITEIGSQDVSRVIREALDRGSVYQAFHDFALIRRLFNWAIGTDQYSVEANPCDRLDPRDLIGERHARDRVLSDDELRALWRVATSGKLPHPFGPLFRLLLLTGLRLGEVCGAHWSEFDIERREWTIPAARMKKVKGGAKPFLVPLTDAAIEVLSSLPHFTSGFLFSNNGKRPVRPSLFSDPKRRLDQLMLEELRKMAGERGDDPERVTLPDYVNHDIRRTVRTHLSALKIGEEVREAVLAHVRPGIKSVYDKYEYLDEKREALALWAARLRSIVEPRPANVIALKASVP